MHHKRSTAVLLASLLTSPTISTAPKHHPSSFHPSAIITRDVAIIGGGSSGTHAAITLKDFNKSVIVVEIKNRLGGHTETYTDPATGLTQDYGVQVYHNESTVLDYFTRFDIPLGQPQYAANSANYDFSTGLAVNVSAPSVQDIGAGFQKYGAFLAQYPKLESGMFLPDPVPEDLTIPFGDLVAKLGLEALVQTMFDTNQGIGDILNVPVVENARVNGLGLVQQLAANSLVATARRNNSELYGKAQVELLDANSLLLSSEVVRSVRRESGVELVVKTPDGVKLVRAKKLLITIPPRVDLFARFDLWRQEREVFGKLIDVGYFAALVKNTGTPDDLVIYNRAPDTPYNLAVLPGVYTMGPTAIPGVKAIYYGSQRSNATYPLSDDFVKGEMIAGIKRLQTANADKFEATEPEFVVFTSHAPFYMQAGPEDIQAGIYDEMNALQGLRSTYWSGATFRAQDSSALWKFNKEIVLPMLMEGL
ncbi:uncharacterized protein J4E84_003593 [Alternaria hordeiaustralica]|uniref:uncharacterized protein n=1 Tax=Alternaria hordeiaustralica TaxID=1187925 RepID=UPI0020C402B6|nr:uncharacterized protein J4E84_003593 [Alternaria hordeiaustralica]KAI4691302.1 hypothetical protein J4E84_003593 [Alternaria hordeiaustralica]